MYINTPKKQNILIDAGEGHNEKYDMGKNVALPYLFDRGEISLDYVIVSHFDSDHVGGLLSIMEEIKIGRVIIPKQVQTSDNYESLLRISKEKKVEVLCVEKGEVINIEKGLAIYVLWPNGDRIINENVLNNNSLVFKLAYNGFSLVSTGDIEKVAEEAILKEYENNMGILASNVLKVPHHGSKTSSTEGFLDAVNPDIALIGVGKNNKFGHPSGEVVERLNLRNIKVYRTDLNGEIMITINKNGVIKKSLSHIR